LANSAVRFQNGTAVIHHSCQIGIGKRDSSERSGTQNASWSWLAAAAKKESRLGIQVGMPPTIQDDTGNVTT
jgi:hypothetical protein